jgi:transcriptional regulator with XRE-family HTH domain
MAEKYTQADGRRLYEEARGRMLADPRLRVLYEEEAAKMELWLQLAEARQAAGLSQQQLAERLGVSAAQVARMEKHGYDRYTLKSLRRYVAALGEGFLLEVRVCQLHEAKPDSAVDKTYGVLGPQHQPMDLKALREMYEDEVALEVLAETPPYRRRRDEGPD